MKNRRNIIRALFVLLIGGSTAKSALLGLINEDNRDEISKATTNVITDVCGERKILANLIFHKSEMRNFSFMEIINEVLAESSRDFRISLKIMTSHDEESLGHSAQCNIIIMSSSHNFKPLYSEALISHLANEHSPLLIVLLSSLHDDRKIIDGMVGVEI
jgi:hypothetical protein